MEDDLFLKYQKWKTTSILFNRRRTQFVLKKDDNIIFLGIGRKPQFVKRKTTLFFYEMKMALNGRRPQYSCEFLRTAQKSYFQAPENIWHNKKNQKK